MYLSKMCQEPPSETPFDRKNHDRQGRPNSILSCRSNAVGFLCHDEEHCPNPDQLADRADKAVPSEVRVKYALETKIYTSPSNRRYEEWGDRTFPHLTTRFEDLLFHGEEVTRKACECVGGVFTDDFEYVGRALSLMGFNVFWIVVAM